jgi:hypothetical protein
MSGNSKESNPVMKNQNYVLSRHLRSVRVRDVGLYTYPRILCEASHKTKVKSKGKEDTLIVSWYS